MTDPHHARRHLDVDQLGDYVDGLLAPADAAATAAHLAACGACAARLDALRALLDRAAAAPQSIEPPRDLWPLVRARIDARIGASSSTPRAPRARWWSGGTSLAAAAALVLVLASSAATTLLVREPTSRLTTATVRSRPAELPAAAPAAPADYQRLDTEYARIAVQLAAAVRAERGTLAPATVATVEQSLRTIDAAIAEARAALEQDPHNPALVEMFSASYQQKLTLLRRAAQLPSQL